MGDPSRFTLPPPGALCELCGQREVTGGTSYMDGDREVTVTHCDVCEAGVPVGHAVWCRAEFECGSSPREPAAACDRCGAIGTVARVTRHQLSPSVKRFCRTCWPAERGELQLEREARDERVLRGLAGRDATPGRPRTPRVRPLQDRVTWESRAWIDMQEFLELIASSAPQPLDPKLGVRVAREILDTASDMDGPMPPDVAAFVEKYAPVV